MKRMISFLVMFTVLVSMLIPNAYVQAANFNYGEALQKSLIFYEFQRAGKLPADKRDNWRGDAAVKDGSDVKLDLTGGWFDAGDHVKFNLPMSYTANMLAWSVYENRDAYVKSGQLKYVMDSLKWVNDYFIKCHTGPTEYYFQVGNGIEDHNWWGQAEVMAMARPSYKVTASNPGATVVAGTAASLAAASVVFKESNPSYAATCLQHAKELYSFGDKYQSDTGYSPAASNFYNSGSKWYDELAWACIWLYLATNDSSYIEKAKTYIPNFSKETGSQHIGYKWTHCWDDVRYGVFLMLAKITDESTYKEAVERNLDYWTAGYGTERIKYSPKGLAFLSEWGSLRYATTAAFLADVYADWSGCTPSKVSAYKSFAKNQLDYALGSTGRSFVVGYGTNPPVHPHHRTAHGSWANSMEDPPEHRHVLVGALVGGPDGSDTYKDSIGSYTTNEVACDYNAGFTALCARMYDQFGGNPIANFNAVEKPGLEVYVGGTATTSSTGTSLKVFMTNISAWPARSYDKLSFRYFMDLSELYAAGHTASEVKTIINYSVGGKAGGIFPYDEEKHIYYGVIDFTGEQIVPGGATIYKKEAQVIFEGPAGVKWDGTNDFSYKGFSSTTPDNPNIPVYNEGVRISGFEPDGAAPSVPPTNPPSTSPTEVVPTPTKLQASSTPRNNASITGYIAPNSGSMEGFKVEVEGTGISETTDEKGYFRITIPARPGHILKISKKNYLSRTINIGTTMFADYTVGSMTSPISMWAGDILINGFQDDAINMTDIMEVARGFNSTAGNPLYSENSDINADGSVNMADIMIIAEHFNKAVADYPEPQVKMYPVP
jgi:hypothetical protein